MTGIRWLFLLSLLAAIGAGCEDRPPKKPLDASNRDMPQGGSGGGGGMDARDGSGDQLRDGSDGASDDSRDASPTDGMGAGGDLTGETPADTTTSGDGGPG
jgi:hypothetical protein